MNEHRSTASHAGGAATLAADGQGMAEAARLLAAGWLVALPTETVYGLAADATNPVAVARIYAAKGRPAFNPLIAHVPDTDSARRQGLFNAPALALARAFWPGPLTLVVPMSPDCTVCDLARAGLSTVGLRVPDHAATRAVIERLGRPVAAPSANRSGHVSPTSAAHVLADLGQGIDAVLDAGPCSIGVESTIIACLGGSPRLLRPGGITRAAAEAVIGRKLVDAGEAGAAPIAPGQLQSHYAPDAALRLDADAPVAGEAWLGFGPDPLLPADGPRANLSARGDLVEAAANLFDCLRRLDASGARRIAVARIPAHGLGEAILDRLGRAAAPR
ncbi:MAG: L-threonylcarbamoyladenylate synthase [Beijerinckiaceae bacterium]|jgi:L-threonylcarbamoyladenylate synthase|nr:L-threonylcarbamoyladenylate synthase [Beijerinckiaceae bacterium]